jgi:hypothetical protein
MSQFSGQKSVQIFRRFHGASMRLADEGNVCIHAILSCKNCSSCQVFVASRVSLCQAYMYRADGHKNPSLGVRVDGIQCSPSRFSGNALSLSKIHKSIETRVVCGHG